MFDPKQLIRKSSVIHDALEEVVDGENVTLVAKKRCKIYIPQRFRERNLANIGESISIAAIFCIVVDDKYYGVSSACAMMRITPDITNIVDVFGEPNYEFTFEKGSVICPNLNLVKQDTFVYSIYSEILSKVHVPWFFNYVDVATVMETCDYHGGIRLAPSNVPVEIVVATIARDPSNRKQYFRHSVESIYERTNPMPAFLTNTDVTYGATNLTAKLMGAYLDDGIVSALVNPSDTVETIESLLRQ